MISFIRIILFVKYSYMIEDDWMSFIYMYMYDFDENTSIRIKQ